MAETDGNPPPSIPPADPPAPTAPADPKSALPGVLTPAPRTNPPSVFHPKDAAPPSPPPVGSNDFASWLQAFVASQTPPPAPAALSQRTTLPKNEKKFRRYDPETAKTEAGPNPSGQGVAEGAGMGRTPLNRGDLPEPSGETPVVHKRRLKPASLTGSRWYKWLLPWSSRLAVLAAVFAAGRLTAPNRHPVAVSAVPRATVDRAEPGTKVPALIDQAMAAEAKMDFAKATGLLQQVRAEKSRVMGIDYHLALLAYESGDLPRVLSLLNHSIEQGEEVAACYNLRGTVANRTGGITQGLGDLETATQVDPYNAKYFYFVGEALRRAGKPLAALQRLRQASDRARDPAAQSLYDLKVRLAQIESGQENDFAGQLAAQLRLTPPPLDWLFTAAAVEMHAGRFDDAAGSLDKIVALSDQATINVRLSDYFFYGFANEKSLARFYAPLRSATAAAVPAARTAVTLLSTNEEKASSTSIPVFPTPALPPTP